MIDIPREIIFFAFILSYAVFSLVYILLTANWPQRSVLLFGLIPVGGGIGIGLGKGESIDVLLLSLSGFLITVPVLLVVPRRRISIIKEIYRRDAAGEKVDWKEAEPPTWLVWTYACAICLWAAVSFVITGG
ncbi:hypothetical protein [Streptomyces sp. NPDC095613]|uniref:hypothetical protein n=1 Tax=Streptomyces sp. NPDC095613 TaxID=3155540 RepID=UPI003317DA0E